MRALIVVLVAATACAMARPALVEGEGATAEYCVPCVAPCETGVPCGAIAAAQAPVPAPVDPCAPGQAHDPAQCPDLDDDGDGVANLYDRCALEAGIAELDGCPARDTDGDTVADHLDRCPDTVGVVENEGCPPERAAIDVEKGKIELSEKIFFDTGKASIQEGSLPLLDDVAALLIANREVGPVEIEGHTDSRGSAELNRKLSQARAEAVKTYLVQKGVDSARLEAKGYGPDRPLEPNVTASGREANRRVEFTVGRK